MVKFYRTRNEIVQFKYLIKTTPFGSLSDERIKRLTGKTTSELLLEKANVGSLCLHINKEFFIVIEPTNYIHIGTINNVSLRTLIKAKNVFKEILKYRVFVFSKVLSIDESPLRVFKPKIVYTSENYSIIKCSYEDL